MHVLLIVAIVLVIVCALIWLIDRLGGGQFIPALVVLALVILIVLYLTGRL